MLVITGKSLADDLSQTSSQNPAFWAWAPTPPMGWNSWDAFATTITEDQAPRQAVDQNTPIMGTNDQAADIADKNSVRPWNPDMFGVDMTKPIRS